MGLLDQLVTGLISLGVLDQVLISLISMGLLDQSVTSLILWAFYRSISDSSLIYVGF